VVSYAETIDGDVAAFWQACPRGDWLLAVALRTRGGEDAARMSAILDAGVAIAALGLDYLPDDDVHARAVHAQLSRACRGEAAPSVDDVSALERDADDAPDPAVSFARRAIVVAARAVRRDDDADLEDLAVVPSLVAQAAAHDAGDCAMISAASFVLRKSAELLRAHVAPPPTE
jgi:hypothetical protein